MITDFKIFESNTSLKKNDIIFKNIDNIVYIVIDPNRDNNKMLVLPFARKIRNISKNTYFSITDRLEKLLINHDSYRKIHYYEITQLVNELSNDILEEIKKFGIDIESTFEEYEKNKKATDFNL